MRYLLTTRHLVTRRINILGVLGVAFAVWAMLVVDGVFTGFVRDIQDSWGEAQRSGIALPCDDPVTAAAFCKARRKLKPALFAILLSKVCALLAEPLGSPRLRETAIRSRKMKW